MGNCNSNSFIEHSLFQNISTIFKNNNTFKKNVLVVFYIFVHQFNINCSNKIIYLEHQWKNINVPKYINTMSIANQSWPILIN